MASSSAGSSGTSTASSQARSSAQASSGPRSAPIAPLAHVALGHQALDHAQHGARVERGAGGAVPVRADGERHRGVRPLRGAALLAARVGAAGAQVVEVLRPRRRDRRLGERAPDVDARVVVAAGDPGPAVGVDVDGGRHVELHRPRAVADLPDREQARQATAVLRGQRRADGVERVGERAGDLVGVQVAGARLDVAGVGLQPLVVAGRDAVAEDVHGLRLAVEGRGQLVRDEHVGAVGDL